MTIPAHHPHRFGRPLRLSGKLAFAAVYDGGIAKTLGPLKIIALPNHRSHGRLGLSVSRRVGTAPIRNRIKRLLREAFRHLEPTAVAGYDFIIVVRPHRPLDLVSYRRHLSNSVERLVTD